MPIAIHDFWKLAVSSGLLSVDRCRQLHAEFANLKGAAQQANTQSLVEWLVATGTLSRYQASVLSAGHGAPLAFGGLVIHDCIDSGRLEHVFRATYKENQPLLLVFVAQLAEGAEQLARVAERAQSAIAVKSPHVVRVYRLVDGRANPFLLVENLEGLSLREWLARKRLSVAEASRVAFQMALGLMAMHAQQTVHGAICPDNAWVDASGTVKLLQFPLELAICDRTQVDARLADYLAPEIESIDDADSMADIYALGCTIFEIVAGRPPFPGGNLSQKRARHEGEIPLRLDQLVPDVPPLLAKLVADMIDKERRLRCQTVKEAAQLLSSLMGGAGGISAPPPQQPTIDRPTEPPPQAVSPAPSARRGPQPPIDAEAFEPPRRQVARAAAGEDKRSCRAT